MPRDPVILLSYINTLLRDSYGGLDALCADRNISRQEVEAILAAAGTRYDPEKNRFC